MWNQQWDVRPGFLRRRDRRRREFLTIREAIGEGYNAGTFGVTHRSKGALLYHWRLLGDDIEFRKPDVLEWLMLEPGDLDYAFSRGVHGRFEQWSADEFAGQSRRSSAFVSCRDDLEMDTDQSIPHLWLRLR